MNIELGSLLRYPPTALAIRAAKLIADAGGLWPVTLDPGDYMVRIEDPEEAAEVDIIGWYRVDALTRLRELEDRIRTDLIHERTLRRKAHGA